MKTTTILPLIFLFSFVVCKAQDTVYLDNDRFKRVPLKKASYMEISRKETKGDSTFYYSEIMTIKGVKEIVVTNIHISKKNGHDIDAQHSPTEQISISNHYFPNGQLENTDTTTNLNLEGTVLSYYPNGQLRRHDHYQAGELTDGHCFTPEGADTTWYIYREIPKYPGGEYARQKFLRDNIEYPYIARKDGISGIVYLSFIVEKDGSIGPVKVLKSPSKILTQEAIKVVKHMPRWEPGIHEGKPCRTQFTMPIKFTLSK